MDPSRFDDLARVLSTTGARRTLLRALFGTVLGSGVMDETMARKRAKGKHRGHDRDERRERNDDRDHGQDRDRQADQRLQTEGRGPGRKRRKHKKKRGGRGNDGGHTPDPTPTDCCGTKTCADPEPGSTRSQCTYAGRNFVGQDHNGSLFRGIDGRESTFTATDNHGSVFAEACLQGAGFRRANLEGSTWGDACLFDADFTGADLGGDFTLFDEALFCRTVMPDGSVNDRDCDRSSRCCQRNVEPGPSCQTAADCTDELCHTKSCQNGQCAYAPIVDGADPNGQCTTHCCEGVCCNPGATECNSVGLCCASNCAHRNCGDDGCGGSCGTCPDGGVCDDISGVCLCTRQSCPDGCCANGPGNPGVCRPGTAKGACGRGGAACATCPQGQDCFDQQCAVCGAQTCSDGCCATDGTCQSGFAITACGGPAGAPCARCTDQQTCQNRQCVDCGMECICTGQSICADPDAPNITCPGPSPGALGICYVSQTGQPICGGGIVAIPPPGCTSDAECQEYGAGSVCVDAVNVPNQPQCSGVPFCVTPSCTPDCAGKVCGFDGCGGTCGGPCGPCERCENGRCQTLQPNGGGCGQDSDCCSGNCFADACSDRVTNCGRNVCNPPAKGCLDDLCCNCASVEQCCGGGCCGDGQVCNEGACSPG